MSGTSAGGYLKLAIMNPMNPEKLNIMKPSTVMKPEKPLTVVEPETTTEAEFESAEVYDEKTFCGGHGEWAHVISKTDRSILGDLKQYDIEDEIKNKADVVYNKMQPQTRRNKVRRQLLFYCTYCAYLELGRDVNPSVLGKIFDLDSGAVQKCYSLFSPLQTGYTPPSSTASPLRYLPDYCARMGLTHEAVTDLISMSKRILNKDRTLLQETPQTVAAGLLRYWIEINGVVIDDSQKLRNITGRSLVTIDTMFKRIANVDNS